MNSKNKTGQEFLKDNGLVFNREELIYKALTHPSYTQQKSVYDNNQRLEFLGDAVLNLVVAEYLYSNYPRKAEGELTKIRAKVVYEKALVDVARKIKLGNYLLLGKGEEMSGGRERKSILADAVEAVIGAIYLDQGYNAARAFVLKHLEGVIKEAARGDYYDYKSKLQEIVQGRNKENVTYAIVKESGPAHCKTFTAGVFYKKQLLATGEGRSKKEAEQNAAKKALQDISFLSE